MVPAQQIVINGVSVDLLIDTLTVVGSRVAGAQLGRDVAFKNFVPSV